MADPLIDNDESNRLVGDFMHRWSLLEYGIDIALKKLLGLGSLQARIVCVNLEMRSKINILKSTLSLYAGKPGGAWIKPALRLIEDIADMSQVRNMVAHTVFMPTKEGEAVEFLHLRARSSLQFDRAVWDSDKFEKTGEEIIKLRDKLDALVEEGLLIKAAYDATTAEKEARRLKETLTEGAQNSLLTTTGTARGTPPARPRRKGGKRGKK